MELMSTTSSSGNSSSSASTRALKLPSSIKVVFSPNLSCAVHELTDGQKGVREAGRVVVRMIDRVNHSRVFSIKVHLTYNWNKTTFVSAHGDNFLHPSVQQPCMNDRDLRLRNTHICCETR